MPKRITIGFIVLLVVASLGLSFGAGCALGIQVPAGPSQGADVIKEAWDVIFREYVDRDKLDAKALSGGAIRGILDVLDDPYTSYLDTETYQLATSDMEGKFDGIGAFVGLENEKITITSPMSDSPAAKAGIKAGDVIMGIDGKSTSGMSIPEAVLRIRGPKGTVVKLLILHQGETDPVEIEITRAEIKIVSVQFEMKEDIGYVHINSFSERTDEELSTALDSINRAGAKGIILDLRGNPGGLLGEVVDVTSRFIKEGVAVSVVDNKGKQSSLSVKQQGVVTNLPVVVLTDNRSASGSEVLAGALQDYDRAVIAGTKTFGKGSVNTLHRLQDGSGIYITIARWLTPKGRLIEGKGIEPDYQLELKGEDAINWAIDYLHGNKRQSKMPDNYNPIYLDFVFG